MFDLTGIEAVEVLLALLPGFLAAEIVDCLVLRKQRTAADRLIHALIYTFLCHLLWSVISWAVPSEPTMHLVGLGLCAVVWAVAITWTINTGKIHDYLRKIGVTRTTSRPNEWYDAFYRCTQYVVLHLRDGRRIFGWPLLYPQDPDKGHVLLTDAEWLRTTKVADSADRISYLVPVSDIELVEFVPLASPNGEGP